MPYTPDAPDIVLPCRNGDNPELRYALRSIEQNMPYGHIWVIGAWPQWLKDSDHLNCIARPKQRNKYATTRAHYRFACGYQRISDPWVMWNDDFFLLRPIDQLTTMHWGPLDKACERFADWRSRWANGMRDTASLLKRLQPRARHLCYDLHTPLTIHSAAMLHALDLGSRIPAAHIRTLYGNLAKIGGTYHSDPKTYSTPHNPKTWLSSHESTFASAVLPTLQHHGLTTPAAWEKRGIPDKGLRTPPRARNNRARQRRMTYRVLPDPTTGRQRIYREPA
jgi:hypothetical protein